MRKCSGVFVGTCRLRSWSWKDSKSQVQNQMWIGFSRGTTTYTSLCKVFCCCITGGLWNVAYRKGCWFDKAEGHIRFLQIQQTGLNKWYWRPFFKDSFLLFLQMSTFSEGVVSGASITHPKKRQWFLINKQVVIIINYDKLFGDDCLPLHRNTN